MPAPPEAVLDPVGAELAELKKKLGKYSPCLVEPGFSCGHLETEG